MPLFCETLRENHFDTIENYFALFNIDNGTQLTYEYIHN